MDDGVPYLVELARNDYAELTMEMPPSCPAEEKTSGLKETGLSTALGISKLTQLETIYCFSVLITVLAGGLCVVGNDQITAQLYVLFGIVLAALFPIGIFVELVHARLPIPRTVVLCLVLTALWTAVLIKYTWKYGW